MTTKEINHSSTTDKPSSIIKSNKSNYLSKTDDAFHDSLENSSPNISRENILIPDSLNNTQFIKCSFIDNNIAHISFKKKELTPKKEISNELNDQEETKKIEYKYMTNYPLNNKRLQSAQRKDNKFIWFAAYGKLLKRKKLNKILGYYTREENQYEIKENNLSLKDFEIIFSDNNKPYIKYSKGSYIFVKLYYLSIDDVNLIFNYINKIEYNFQYETFLFHNAVGDYEKIEHKHIHFNYNYLLCLGSYMNVNIYSFTNLSPTISNSNSNDVIYGSVPKAKKIAKLVNYLREIFPNFSIDFFIYYFLSNKAKDVDINDKFNEIKRILNDKVKNQNKSVNNKSEGSIQSININNFNLNVKVSNNHIKNQIKTKGKSNAPKVIASTQCSSFMNTYKNDFHSLSYNNDVGDYKQKGIKSLNCSKHSGYNVNCLVVNKTNITSNHNSFNKEKRNNNNVYVVNRKMKSDVDFEVEDDSSINTKKSDKKEKVYVTPKKKKIPKYYS